MYNVRLKLQQSFFWMAEKMSAFTYMVEHVIQTNEYKIN